MKKAILFLSLLAFLAAGIFAQVPQKFNYQASLRDNSGQLLSSKTVTLRISIIHGTMDGASVYTEIHSATTTSQGIVNLQIGTGSGNSDFSSIDWSHGPYFLKIELDPDAGNHFTVLGTNSLSSVPYALLARNAEEVNWQNIQDKPNIITTSESPLTISDTLLSIQMADSNTDGYLNKADWNKFNNKVSSHWEMKNNNQYYDDGNVGIGTKNPTSSLEVAKGDIYIKDIDKGIILTSPDGQCWRGTMTNSGTLEFSSVPCPANSGIPSINDQVFNLNENSVNGTLVDTVSVNIINVEQKLFFKILDGNAENAFSIDENTGALFVNDSKFIDYEINPVFILTVEVRNDYDEPARDTANITINLVDISPEQDGLISFYAFQGNTLDSLGNHNGSENNVQYEEGADTNKYLSLNGMDTYVDLNFPFDFESRTINLWFRVTEEQGEISILYVSDNPNLQNGMTIMGVERSDTDVHLTYNFSSQLYTISINENEWYNASITVDHMSYGYYLNGELVKSGNAEYYKNSYNGVETAVVGCGRTVDRSYFYGLIDNLRIYNRALTESEIKSLYTVNFALIH
jgi:hypothetical protein